MKKLLIMLFLILLPFPSFAAKISVKVTFYTCTNNSKTALSNKTPSLSTAAISRSLYRKGIYKGMKIYIPGIGTRIVEDLMSKKVKGDVIDVFVSSREKALKLGLQRKQILLIIPE